MKRYSLIQDILEECFVCKTTQNIHIHHIFMGANRKHSEKYHCIVALCQEHHTGCTGAHQNRALDLYLKKLAQRESLKPDMAILMRSGRYLENRICKGVDMSEEQKEALIKLIIHYGVFSQVDKTMEECSELIKALLKARRKNSSIEGIIDEIADVTIMLEQLKLMFDCEDEVTKRIDYKINRQLERIGIGE